MNKYTIITIVAIIVIIVPFAYSGLSILGASVLEYKWNQSGEFTFFALSNHGDVEFCNTIPFWISWQKFEIKSFYNSRQLGTFIVEPLTMDPLSSHVKKGIFSSEEFTTAQHIFMTFDYEFDGGSSRFNANDFVVATIIHTPILGIIPYQTITQISGSDFDKIMNNDQVTC